MAKLKRGDMLGVRGPFGSCWPIKAASGKDVVIIAGGIGMAPLRPVMDQLPGGGAKSGVSCCIYGARTPDDVLYDRQLERWSEKCEVT